MLLIQRDLNGLEEQTDHKLTNSTRTCAKPGAWEGITPCSNSGWGLARWGTALLRMPWGPGRQRAEPEPAASPGSNSQQHPKLD